MNLAFQLPDDTCDPPPTAYRESPRNRHVWLHCLEFSYTHTLGADGPLNEGSGSTTAKSSANSTSSAPEDDPFWSRVHAHLQPSPRLTRLVWGNQPEVGMTQTATGIDVQSEFSSFRRLELNGEVGVPHSMRAQVWPRLSGALIRRRSSGQVCGPGKSSGSGGGAGLRAWKSVFNQLSGSDDLGDGNFTYSNVLRVSSDENLPAGKQIEKVLHWLFNLCSLRDLPFFLSSLFTADKALFAS
ncbi:unnamed protein product [Protopolystoma xenopodis]|uniref:Rab-GAP TBC domain-containing protein n=1 Tax=Protopolystoma xenopodis TaxID=117903 RepID=A0A3S5BE87_9PLAT|nr:unnamed protein product [Protopolystoma xenopodis]